MHVFYIIKKNYEKSPSMTKGSFYGAEITGKLNLYSG